MIKNIVQFLITEEMKVKNSLNVILVIVAVVIAAAFGLDLMKHVIPIGFLVWFILNPLESKKYAQFALFFLVLTPFFLMIKYDSYAEITSIYAFFSLILTVVYGTIEIKNSRN